MPTLKLEPDYSIILKDFQSCTGNKRDAQYLHNRFKQLINIIQNNDIFVHNFGDFVGYVARPWNQGLKTFRNYIWLGFAHNQYERPQDEVQFQVSIHKNALYMELFVDQAAEETRQKVKHNIEKNAEAFYNLLIKLPNCSVGYSGKNDFQIKCEKINKTDLVRIIRNISERRIHFFVSRELTRSKTEKYSEQIVPEILYTWLQYKPLYNLIENREVDTILKSVTPINSVQSIKRNIRKQFSSQEINLSETEAKASERESRRITYEANWLAQEKANSDHRKTVMLLANHLREHGAKPLQSVIDTFVEKNNRIFIFEVKSIHLSNFIHQTRTAVGQLFDYEYFQIKSNIKNKGKSVIKGIVYSKKPTQEIINFLEDIKFSVYWIESRKISGDSKSMRKLTKFLSDT